MKKLTAFLIAITMLFTSTACGGKKNSKFKETPAAVTVSQTSYSSAEVILDESYDLAYANQISAYDDGICLLYSSNDGKIKFARTDNEYNLISSAVISESNHRSIAFSVNNDGSFDIVIANTDFEFEYDENQDITNWEQYYTDAEFTFQLMSYDNNGNLISQCDIEEIGKFYSAGSGLRVLIPWGEDRFLLNFGNGFALFDRDGNIIDLDAGNQYNSCDIAPTSDGRIICTQYHSYGFMKPDSVAIPSDMTYSEELAGNYLEPVKGNGAFIAYFNLSGGLYGLTENGDIIQVIDYDKSLMSCTRLIPYKDGVFISATGTNKIMVYTRRPDDYVENRKDIDFWIIDGGGTGWHDKAKEFCALNDQYYINVKENVKFDDVPTAILTGDGPDILTYNRSGDMYKLVNMGGLTDLTPYLDGDTGISRDEIMPNVLDAYTYHGGIYSIPENFSIQLTMAKKNIVSEEYRNWSIKDFLEVYDNCPQEMAVFDRNDGFLTAYLCSEDIWTDHEKGTCNYDSEEFIRILEICKEHEKKHSEFEYDDKESLKTMLLMLKDEKALLGANTVYLQSLSGMFNSLGSHGLNIEDVSLLNFPGCVDGRIYMNSCYSIVSNSDCPDGAWKFISYILNEEDQDKSAWMCHPINKKVFEKSIKECIDPPEGRKTALFGMDDLEITYENSASEEQIKRYHDFVLNCRTLRYDDRDIEDIFTVEYHRFLDDKITARECAQTIQERVEILLSEQAN